ncbi:MAG TPA: sigma-70 family RNA polymerase sigma factor [Candidatus Eremiobacteraceae bacterium]|nr:sigma-70 family RNA polymerase sigma factor [Candidatus Eremiobacteraceae bacterium]
MDRPKPADETLIAALAGNELDALDVLYDRYHRVAFSMAYRVLGDRLAAEDVVQDAFLSVWRQARSFRADRGSARTWLMAIVHHRAIDKLRSHANMPNFVPLEVVQQRESDAPGTWAQVWSSLSGDVVRSALEQLPAEQKKSIELAFFSGYTHVEIAGLMGVPLGTVKGRMRIGLQKLKSMLDRPEAGVTGA